MKIKKDRVSKKSPLFKILQGVSMEEVNAARGAAGQEIRRVIEPKATKIELVKLSGK